MMRANRRAPDNKDICCDVVTSRRYILLYSIHVSQSSISTFIQRERKRIQLTLMEHMFAPQLANLCAVLVESL